MDSGFPLDVAAMPPQVQDVVRAAYGEAAGRIFLIAAGLAALGVIASQFLTPAEPRDSVDL